MPNRTREYETGDKTRRALIDLRSPVAEWGTNLEPRHQRQRNPSVPRGLVAALRLSSVMGVTLAMPSTRYSILPSSLATSAFYKENRPANTVRHILAIMHGNSKWFADVERLQDLQCRSPVPPWKRRTR